MQYGYFDDERREYVITRPDTPAPWANYLGSPKYGAVISNNAGGYSFAKSGADGRIIRYVLTALISRDVIFIFVTMIGKTIGQHPGSRLERIQKTTKVNAVMEQDIQEFAQTMSEFTQRRFIMCLWIRNMRSGV